METRQRMQAKATCRERERNESHPQDDNENQDQGGTHSEGNGDRASGNVGKTLMSSNFEAGESSRQREH